MQLPHSAKEHLRFAEFGTKFNNRLYMYVLQNTKQADCFADSSAVRSEYFTVTTVTMTHNTVMTRPIYLQVHLGIISVISKLVGK